MSDLRDLAAAASLLSSLLRLLVVLLPDLLVNPVSTLISTPVLF